MARASRVRKHLSSSTISSVRSPGIGAGAGATSVLVIIAELPTFRSAKRGRFTAQVLICGVEIRARPAHAHHRALLGRGPVQESERRPSAFQQRLGNEKT